MKRVAKPNMKGVRAWTYKDFFRDIVIGAPFYKTKESVIPSDTKEIVEVEIRPIQPKQKRRVKR